MSTLVLTGSFHLQGRSIEGIQEELRQQDRQPTEPQSTKPLLSGCHLWPQEICQLLEIAQFCMADFWIQTWYLSSVFFGRLCNNSSNFFHYCSYIWVQPLFDSCRTFWSRTFSTPRFNPQLFKPRLFRQWTMNSWTINFSTINLESPELKLEMSGNLLQGISYQIP